MFKRRHWCIVAVILIFFGLFLNLGFLILGRFLVLLAVLGVILAIIGVLSVIGVLGLALESRTVL